jgi:hypothetical protein
VQKKNYDTGALSNIGTKGGQTAADIERANQLGSNGKATGSGGGTQMGPEGVANPTGASPQALAPKQVPAGPVYDKTGRLVADGGIANVPNASLGQIVGAAVGAAPFGMGMLNSTGDYSTDPNQAPRGGWAGRFIDGIRGVEPGAVEGQVANRVASNTNARGDRPSDDTRLMDRASAAAQAGLNGGTPTDSVGDDGGAEFSSVRLADRRRPYDDVSAADLLRGLL